MGSLDLVPTPGHTPGHVAFLDTRDGALIAGDTFTSYGRLAVASHFYLRFPLAAMATWDKVKIVESARRLRSLDPDVLVVGHGPATRDPGAAMDQAIARGAWLTRARGRTDSGLMSRWNLHWVATRATVAEGLASTRGDDVRAARPIARLGAQERRG